MTKIEKTKSALLQQYLADDRPWVVAYSGGKDSTLVLQLVFELLLEMGSRAKKPVFVISSDTGVEAPNVSSYVQSTLERIQESARARRLRLVTELVMPEPGSGFWGKMIGKGYPPPSRWFRWCTSSMKIRPSRAAIEKIVVQHGSVILLLGSRVDESAQRGASMQARINTERGLNPHHEIPNALVFAPISNWTTDEVWEYLYTVPPAWGGSHDALLNLYRQANGGECPVVLDLNTPSCGGSRFGCWTCTVVKQDKSMEGFIATGDTWMQPLNDFRAKLIEYRDARDMRSPVKRDGRYGDGPFNPEARKKLLQELLATEKSAGIELITNEEMGEIQAIWHNEFDYTGREVSRIAALFDREVVMANAHIGERDSDELIEALLEEAAGEAEIDIDLLRQVLYLTREKYPSLDVWGAKKRLEEEFDVLIRKAVQQAEQAAP